MTSPIPFTVIGGFLGAGKTTLLNRVLREARDTRFAVLVNDFGDINIDASLIESHDGQTMSLANGCICCSLANGFIKTMIDLMQMSDKFDHIVVEASGVSEPGKIMDFARVDRELCPNGIVVLIDAASFTERLADQKLTSILTTQVQSADLLVINKVDQACTDTVETTRSNLGEIAQDTPIIVASHAVVPLQLLLGLDPAPTSVNAAMQTGHGHSDAEALFHTATLTIDHPVDRETFEAFAAALPSHILRGKGFIIIESRTFLWQRVGTTSTLTRIDHTARHGAEIVLIGTSPISREELQFRLAECCHEQA